MSEQPSDLLRLIVELESCVNSPERGLPEPVFLLISRLTPLLSVDLLIRDDMGPHAAYLARRCVLRSGLARSVRYPALPRDRCSRIQEVARLELGAQVDFEPTPMSIQEFFRANTGDRAHTVSMLYRCQLLTSLDEGLRFDPSAPKPGGWQWHTTCPENLIPEQRPYESYLG